MNMLKNPEQAAMVRSRPELDGDAFEEVLRFEPPVQLSFPRQAQQDVELEGWQFAKGDIAHAMFAAANRDPSHFSDPDRLDVTRPAGQHYAFGRGIHYCLGTGLARLEGSVALPAFLRRFPDAALIEDRPAQLKGSMQIRGLTSLPVSLRG
jgi:cytochrome P450